MESPSAPVRLYRWKLNAWQNTGRSGTVSTTIDTYSGATSGRISLIAPDGTVMWWRHLQFDVSHAVDEASPKKVNVQNGSKQFALLFDDEDSAAQFSQKLTEVEQSLRASRFFVVKTKQLMAMKKELERLRTELNEVKSSPPKTSSTPLRADTSSPPVTFAPSTPIPRASTTSAVDVIRPPQLRSRHMRMPFIEHTISPISTIKRDSSDSLRRSSVGIVNAIVLDVTRNSNKRAISRRASTPASAPARPHLPRRLSLPCIHSWELPIIPSPSPSRTASAVSSPPSSTPSSPLPTSRSTPSLLRRSLSSKSLSKLTKRDQINARVDTFKSSVVEHLSHLTPEQYVTYIISKNTDKATLNTFFLVFRRYISQEKLLDRLMSEFINSANNKSHRARVAEMAATWAREYYPDDFANSPPLVAKLFDLRNAMIGAGFKDLEELIPDIDSLYLRSTSVPPTSRSSTSGGVSFELPSSHSSSGVSQDIASESLGVESTRLVASTSTSAVSLAVMTWSEALTASPSSGPTLTTTTTTTTSQASTLSNSDKVAAAAAAAAVSASNHALLASPTKDHKNRSIWRLSTALFTKDATLSFDNILKHGVKAIARELTLMDLHVQQQVRPLDIVSFKEDHAAPSVRRQADHFNNISYWVANEIVTVPNISKRVHVMQAMISLASKLKKLQNFNSLMAIVAGLNTHSVSRLKLSWGMISAKRLQTFDQLEKFMDILHNFRVYRHFLSEAQPPAVPYFGLVLRDITLLDEGSADVVQGEVNRDKVSLLSSLCNDIIRFQSSKYTFKSTPAIRQYLGQQKQVSDEELERFSRLCEPTAVELH